MSASILIPAVNLSNAEGVFYVITDPQLRILETNPLFLSLTGKTFHEQKGQSLSDIELFQEFEEFESAYRHCCNEPQSSRNFELPITDIKNDFKRWFRCELRSLSENVSEENGFLCTGTEHTQQKKMEEELMYQASLSEQISDAVISTDLLFTIRTWNKAAEDIYHFSKEEMIGKNAGAVFQYNYINDTEEAATLELIEKKQWKGEVYFNRHDDGKKIYLLASVTAVLNPQQVIVGYVAVNRDITCKKDVEKQLKLNEEERLRLVLHSLGDNAWEYDFLKKRSWISSGISFLLGYTKEEITETSIAELWRKNIHPDDYWMVEKMFVDYLTGRHINHLMEYRIFQKNGTLKWVLDKGAVIEKTAEGNPLRVVGTHTDITKEKKLQELENQREKQKQKQILAAVITEQENERRKIAFELHENISQLLAMSKVLLSANLSNDPQSVVYYNKAEQVIGTAINEMRRISNTIDPSNLQTVGLVNTVNDLVMSLNKNQQVRIRIDSADYETKWTVNPDVELAVFRIIQEKLDNIIRHSKATNAFVQLSNTEHQLFLTVSDDGIGFDLKSKNESFGIRNMFNRCELYDGTIDMQTEPGKGCIMKLVIPAG